MTDSMQTTEQSLVLWCDLETTGSKRDNCDTIEYAFILTENHYQFPEIWRDTGLIDSNNILAMPDVVDQMHKESGLYHEIMDNTIFKFANVLTADTFVSASIQRVMQSAGYPLHTKITLAGSGVSHFDSMILQSQWPYTWSLLSGFDDSDMLKPTLDLGVVRRFFRILNWPMPDSDEYTPTRPHRALDDVNSFLAQSRRLMRWLTEYYPNLEKIREAEEYLRAKGE